MTQGTILTEWKEIASRLEVASTSKPIKPETTGLEPPLSDDTSLKNPSSSAQGEVILEFDELSIFVPI